jgi:hypothetical protein
VQRAQRQAVVGITRTRVVEPPHVSGLQPHRTGPQLAVESAERRTAGPTPRRWWTTRTSCAAAVTPRRRRPVTACAFSPTAVRTSGISVAGNSPSTTARAVARSTAGSCSAFSTAARNPTRRVLLCQRPHKVHRHVDVKLPPAFGAEPGERVCNGRGAWRETLGTLCGLLVSSLTSTVEP